MRLRLRREVAPTSYLRTVHYRAKEGTTMTEETETPEADDAPAEDDKPGDDTPIDPADPATEGTEVEGDEDAVG